MLADIKPSRIDLPAVAHVTARSDSDTGQDGVQFQFITSTMD